MKNFTLSARTKSFTLIELLVVIAVIGLLSSIVLVQIKTPREEARIAKLLDFSLSIQNILGPEGVGTWSFDDQTNPTKDSSGYGKNGTVNNTTFTDDTPHKVVGNGGGRYALNFSGNAYVSVSQVLSGNGPFTAEAWIKPTDTGSWRTILGETCSGFTLTINGGTLYFGKNCGSPWYYGPTMKVNAWSHVIMIFDGTNTNAFVDGVQYTGGSALTYAHANLFIGSYNGASEFFYGIIDEVRVYSQALNAFQIQKHYVEGLEKYKNLASQEP